MHLEKLIKNILNNNIEVLYLKIDYNYKYNHNNNKTYIKHKLLVYKVLVYKL